MSKLRAFGFHLAISICAAGALIYLLARYWYPMPYFVADGGWQGIRLIAAIDVVLGPLLTLVVYNRRKSRKALLFDYTVIGMLQVAAMGFGIWTTFNQRTVMVVFADGSFYTLNADMAARAGGNAVSIVKASPAAPAYAAIQMPDDLEAQQQLRREALQSGRPLYLLGDLLRPLDAQTFDRLESQSLDIQRYIEANPSVKPDVETFLNEKGSSPAQYLFFRTVSRYQHLILAFDRSNRNLVEWFRAPDREKDPGRRATRRSNGKLSPNSQQNRQT